MARHLAPGPGLGCNGGSRGAGKGCPYYRAVGRRLRRGRALGPRLRAVRRPPALGTGQQAELKGAVQEPPAGASIDLANWNWKVVRRFVEERFGLSLSRSSCLNYLHRLGFVLKRPKKRLVKADEAKRDVFVAAYAALVAGARQAGKRIIVRSPALHGAVRLYPTRVIMADAHGCDTITTESCGTLGLSIWR